MPPPQIRQCIPQYLFLLGFQPLDFVKTRTIQFLGIGTFSKNKFAKFTEVDPRDVNFEPKGNAPGRVPGPRQAFAGPKY